MTQAEFEGWQEFYVRYPFDDLHRFHRPAALVAAMSFSPDGRQQAFNDHLEVLAPDSGTHGLSDADVTTMRTFGFARKEG